MPPEFRQAGVEATALTVLCVDDEPNILNALRRLLRAQGYNVLTAERGLQAIEMMTRNQVDLVVSDMRMPEMDGARFLSEVKARSPQTIRILLTGYADLASTVQAINSAEIYRYISKPWDDATLVAAVRDSLERKVLEREKAQLEQLTQRQNLELKELNATLESKVAARTAELATTLDALGNAHDKLKKSFLASIRVFANLIELREGAVAGHSRHVAESSRRLARRMKLSDSDAQDVAIAGLLHGIGEFAIGDQMLRKPVASLTPDDRLTLFKHPARAQAALMGLEQLNGAAKLIRSYRENYDGLGYPDKLNGISIPLGARILSVAHDFEAAQDGTLTGRSLSKLQAREFVLQGRGKRYDPEVVDAYVAMLDDAGVKPISERSLPPVDLRTGMVLSRDLLTVDGMLLLAKNTVLRPDIIEQLRKYAARDGSHMLVHVRGHSNA